MSNILSNSSRRSEAAKMTDILLAKLTVTQLVSQLNQPQPSIHTVQYPYLVLKPNINTL